MNYFPYFYEILGLSVAEYSAVFFKFQDDSFNNIYQFPGNSSVYRNFFFFIQIFIIKKTVAAFFLQKLF